MADIFISYSKQDPDHAVALAADLEARGYSVWWDTSLLPGDEFPEKIKSQIDEAKAVIVIWTPNSVQSKWVRAEAARADEQNKLITVHAPSLDFHDIPMPFNTRHSTAVTDREEIYNSLSILSDRKRDASTRKPRMRSYLRLGIVLSIVWAVTAFLYVQQAERHRAQSLLQSFYERCKSNGEQEYSDASREWYPRNPNQIYPKTLRREFYQKCEYGEVMFGKPIRDNATQKATDIALLPIPIAWLFSLLMFYIVRWIQTGRFANAF